MSDPVIDTVFDEDDERADNSEDYSSESAYGSDDSSSDNGDSSVRGNDAEDDANVSDVVFFAYVYVNQQLHNGYF